MGISERTDEEKGLFLGIGGSPAALQLAPLVGTVHCDGILNLVHTSILKH